MHAPFLAATPTPTTGSVAVAGLGISWLKDNLGLIAGPHESEELAASVPNTGGLGRGVQQAGAHHQGALAGHLYSPVGYLCVDPRAVHTPSHKPAAAWREGRLPSTCISD
jgi:hypothetical protein